MAQSVGAVTPRLTSPRRTMDASVSLHALIPNGAGTHVVATTDGTLPVASLALPPDRPAIGAVVGHLRAQLGLDAPVLEASFRWDVVEDGDPIPSLVVVEPPREDWQLPAGLGWWPTADGIGELPGPIRDRAATWITEFRTAAPPPALRPRWARIGWHARATTWATQQLAAIGRPPTGRLEFTHLRGFSAVLRAPTASGDVYFKAVFPPLHHEPTVSTLLEQRFPGATAPVIAIEAIEGWMLMDDLRGSVVRETKQTASLGLGLRALVAIQRELATDLDPFRAVGCPTRPLSRLASDLAAALGDPEVPSGRSAARVDELVARVSEAAERVEALGMPTSIVHGDFHVGNVVVRDDHAIVFDWSDAAIGNPVVDLVTWLWELDADTAKVAAVDAWLDAWSGIVAPDGVRERLPDILALGAAYQVVSYVSMIRALEPATRYSLSDELELFLDQLDAAAPTRQ